MYKDKKVIIQTMLFAYPDICMDRKQRDDRHIAEASSCGGCSEIGRVDGGQTLSAQDRYADEMDSDAQLGRANAVIQEMQRGFQKLSRDEYNSIRLVYFEREGRGGAAKALAVSESSLDKKVERAFFLLQDNCSRIYWIFCEWRRYWNKERKELLAV